MVGWRMVAAAAAALPQQGLGIERVLEHGFASSLLAPAARIGGFERKPYAKGVRPSENGRLDGADARYAQNTGKPARFDKRNFAIRILALGIKSMESLTLSPISVRFLIAVGLTVMAVYRLWVVGYPPRYVDQPLQEWLIRSRRAEMVGEWVDGVIAT